MTHSRLLLLPLLVACSATAADPCETAADHVMDCFGEALDSCDETVAARINSSTCEELVESADPDGKADGFCPRWLWWLCADGPVTECPSAGEPVDYAQFTNDEQRHYHWEWALCTEYGEGENPALERRTWDLVADAARGAVTSLPRFARAFTNSDDELDTGRVKLLHPYGSLVQLRWVAADADEACNEPYTGLFAESGQTTLARFSLAADPRAIGTMPGVALKFFVEGRESVNLHTVRDPLPDANYFNQSISNVIPEPDNSAGRLLVGFLGLFVEDASRLRLGNIASVTSDGDIVSDPVIPWEIELTPTQEAVDAYQAALDEDPEVDFRAALGTIAAGTPIYDVYARAEEGACLQHLATLISETEFVAAVWGDRRLQFQHSTIDQGF